MKTIQFMKDILKLENELLKKMRRSEKKMCSIEFYGQY